MLLVLKRTASMRRFFGASKPYAKTDSLEKKNTILRYFLLIRTYVLILKALPMHCRRQKFSFPFAFLTK